MTANQSNRRLDWLDYVWLALIVAWVIYAASRVRAEETPTKCMKVAFERYCLGGAEADLPKPDQVVDGRYVYLDPAMTLVSLHAGRVANVARAHTRPSWLRYRDIENEIREQLGRGKDLSSFPKYANDESSRETSIAIGKGRAVRQWDGDGWSLQLKWTNRTAILLVYYHDELEKQRQTGERKKY